MVQGRMIQVALLFNDQGKKKRKAISNMGNSMWGDLEPVIWSEMESAEFENIICDQ